MEISKKKYDNSSDQIILIKGERVYEGKYDNSSEQIDLLKGDNLTNNELEKIAYLLAQKNNLV